MAGHVSKQMLKHYSHIGMEAKRRAVQALVPKKEAGAAGEMRAATSEAELGQIPESSAKDSTKVAHLN